MITQTIQYWLSKLFAWWPWQKSSERAYAPTVGNVSKGTTQDPVGRMWIDGAQPQQAGSMSIAVEHELIDNNRPPTDERADPFAQSPPTTIPDERTVPLSTSIDPARKTASFPGSKATSSPTPEQKLAFLQYLVKRGTFNEGFSVEQVPEQYQQNP